MHTRNFLKASLLTMGLALMSGTANAYFEVLSLISNGAVLQRDQPIRLSGGGDNGDVVTAQIGREKATAKVANGRWEVVLPAMKAGGPHTVELSTASGTKLSFADVLVGEVWVASGQSNMKWPVKTSLGSEETLKSAHNRSIRLFRLEYYHAMKPADNVCGSWEVATPESVGEFSGVGWHFASELQKELGVPVGVIQSSVGGSIAACWTSDATLKSNPVTPKYWQDYNARVGRYVSDYEAFLKGGGERPAANLITRRPSGYYNAMIAPLTRYTIGGVIWYQGETDSWKAEDYPRFFRDLITSWRSDWKQPKLPFYFVQLPGYDGKPGADYNYPFLRDAQAGVLDLPNTAMAVTLDVGDKMDLHPTNKKPVGERLARLALAKIFGQSLLAEGPVRKAVEFKGGKAVVTFLNAGKGLYTLDGKPPRGFELAGEDGVFHEAIAEIDGASVITLTSGSVRQPKHARYAWRGFVEVNLVNSVQLPAAPFRTDSTPWRRPS